MNLYTFVALCLVMRVTLRGHLEWQHLPTKFCENPPIGSKVINRTFVMTIFSRLDDSCMIQHFLFGIVNACENLSWTYIM
jgi:hypothetical protein